MTEIINLLPLAARIEERMAAVAADFDLFKKLAAVAKDVTEGDFRDGSNPVPFRLAASIAGAVDGFQRAAAREIGELQHHVEQFKDGLLCLERLHFEEKVYALNRKDAARKFIIRAAVEDILAQSEWLLISVDGDEEQSRDVDYIMDMVCIPGTDERPLRLKVIYARGGLTHYNGEISIGVHPGDEFDTIIGYPNGWADEDGPLYRAAGYANAFNDGEEPEGFAAYLKAA